MTKTPSSHHYASTDDTIIFDPRFFDPTHGYSIPTPSTSQAEAPPKAPAKPKSPRQPKSKREKLGAILKKKCPQNILGRLLMVIKKSPSASKGNHCKHILLLQVTYESPYCALLTTELQDVFARAPNAIMHTEPENKLTWCEVCGNALHGVCFAQCKLCTISPILCSLCSYPSKGKKVTCVWCRAEWVLRDAGKGKGKAIGDEGYVNLAAVAGVSTQRDTSSYYHGVRRGSKYYGYQKYRMR
ncbi:uncharacterized protein BT62DRAFT_982451 [Guyanagaster necrorhizus]|uniref:Uncharacterized protein n=1 Tax=Guyanagaster necrorhizus TaxID=856835 RepID=A0A9P7VLA7_9AGAR|nr:uncharacterized protein BT62DRAFT_982451 [Guyanagaster necrorhizus MCA 3950]KAG7442572.1 hypothetical protein BT62DRAFT_982451 [Guyanagaster necrorhizus MCA 3950]